MEEHWIVPDGINKTSCGEEVFKKVLIRLGLITSLSLMKCLPFDVYECATASDEDWDCLKDAFTSEQAQSLRREARIELMKNAGVYVDVPAEPEPDTEKKLNTEKNRKKREKKKAKKIEKLKVDKLEKDLNEVMTREITVDSKDAIIERQKVVICKLGDQNRMLKKKINVINSVNKIQMDTYHQKMKNMNIILIKKLQHEGFGKWLEHYGYIKNQEYVKRERTLIDK